MEARAGRGAAGARAALLESLLREGARTLIDEARLERSGDEREDYVAAAVELVREAPGAFRLHFDQEPLPLGRLSIVLRDRARAAALLSAKQDAGELGSPASAA